MAALDDLKVKTAELLDEGLKTGTLTVEEHSWRTGHLAAADTVDALEVLVEDLLTPPSETSVLVAARTSELNLMSNRTFLVADLGRRTELVTVMGSTKLDLRSLAPGEALTLEVVTIMGDTTVEVPAGVKVKVDCTPVMGDTQIDPGLRSQDASVRITGVVVMGSLRVIPARPST